VKNNAITINGNVITLTLNWEEMFDDHNSIVNYTISCSGDVTCPPDFTTIDNTVRSYTITNLAPMTSYTFSVVATNFDGSEEDGTMMITTPGKISMKSFVYMYLCMYVSMYAIRCHQKLHNFYIHFHYINTY